MSTFQPVVVIDGKLNEIQNCHFDYQLKHLLKSNISPNDLENICEQEIIHQIH